MCFMNHIFINLGREDFLMRIEAEGYDTVDLPVRYEELEEKIMAVIADKG